MNDASLLRNSQKWDHLPNKRTLQVSKQAQQTLTPFHNNSKCKTNQILSTNSKSCPPRNTNLCKAIKTTSNSSNEEVSTNSSTETASTKATKTICTATNLFSSYSMRNKTIWVTSSKTTLTNSSTTTTTRIYSSSTDRSSIITNRCSNKCQSSKLCSLVSLTIWVSTPWNSNHQTEINFKALQGCIRLVFVLSST